eukprot:IDg3121t1
MTARRPVCSGTWCVPRVSARAVARHDETTRTEKTTQRRDCAFLYAFRLFFGFLRNTPPHWSRPPLPRFTNLLRYLCRNLHRSLSLALSLDLWSPPGYARV